ncbi:MAG TPA: DUF427 domain-containing protein [Kofleriaceae bacterium]|jgi:uncharacterized protein (DUF427 family)
MDDRVTVEPIPHIRVAHAGQPIAETTHGFVVHERGLPDRYYVPRSDVRAELSDGTGAGTCPWKGEWKHLDVSVGGTHIANGAWTYFATKPVTDVARDFVAFYESKFEITAG